ncbi:hypothetical protein [Brevundimonas vesicularis]|uniref:hypothetical protein n=1 Tax=Brevundimonas vesicularis TaxID=41276 RepID=UPI0038D3D656
MHQMIVSLFEKILRFAIDFTVGRERPSAGKQLVAWVSGADQLVRPSDYPSLTAASASIS